MKSRFETECGCDFETLNAEQRLAAIRVLANTYPLLVDEFFAMITALQRCSSVFAQKIETAPNAEDAQAACSKYAEVVNELTTAFAGVFKSNAELLGLALQITGLTIDALSQPTTVQ